MVCVVRQKVMKGSTVNVYKYPLHHPKFDSTKTIEAFVLDIWCDLDGLDWRFCYRCVRCNREHELKFNRIASVKQEKKYKSDTEFIVVPFWIDINDFTDKSQDFPQEFPYARQPANIFIPKEKAKGISKRLFKVNKPHNNDYFGNIDSDQDTIEVWSKEREHKRSKTNKEASRHNSSSSSNDEVTFLYVKKNNNGNGNDNKGNDNA